MLLPITATCALLLSPAIADDDRPFQFTSHDLRAKKTDHFLIKYNGKKLDPAKSFAEDTWDACAKVMPNLEADFKNKFRAPAASRNRRDFPKPDEVFRYRIYMIDTNPVYVDLMLEHLARRPNRPGIDTHRALLQRVGMFEDFENRYLVQDINGGRGGAREVQMVHGLASSLLQGQARQGHLPLWLGAGIGYYIEYEMFERCRVFYLDFSAYYKGEGGKVNQGEILDGDTPWTKPLRKLARAGKTEKLNAVIGAEVSTMTPQISGYIFALTSFMLSTEGRAQSYHRMISEIAGGQSPSLAHLLKCFGYDSAAGFESDWYKFVGSAKFR